MTFIPSKFLQEGMSALLQFRSSPLYKTIMKKKKKTVNPLTQSLKQSAATLLERARNWVFQEGKESQAFCNAVIAKLIDSGLDRALLEVEPAGGGCVVYLSDRIGKLSKEIKNMVVDIAEAQVVLDPTKDDSENSGMFIFQMEPRQDVDFQDYTMRLATGRKDVVKQESVFIPLDPNFIPSK